MTVDELALAAAGVNNQAMLKGNSDWRAKNWIF
jgi:hypothetical protein